MASTVILRPDNVIFTVWDDDLKTDEQVRQHLEKVGDLCKELRGKQQRVLILGYLTDRGSLTHSGRNIVVKAFNEFDFDKVAAYGGGPHRKLAADFLFAVVGMHSRVAYFNTEAEAEKWLMRKND